MQTDDTLLQDDIEARRRALDTQASFIVQAPAGSGKTELLIQRYLALLSKVDEPEEILAITFTNKAAAEMRLRVIDALQRVSDGEPVEEAHLQRTADLATAALQRAEQRNWQILRNPRRLRIQTLDALNGAIARSQPLSAGSQVSGARIVTDAELKSLYRAAALATLDWLAESDPHSAATASVLEHVDNATWQYVDYLAAMLSRRDQWLPILGSGALTAEESQALRRQFEQNLRASVEGHLERVRSLLSPYEQVAAFFDDAASALIAAERSGTEIIALQGLDDLPGASTESMQPWLGVVDLLLKRGTRAAFRTSVNVQQGFPPTAKDRKEAFVSLLAAMQSDTELCEALHAIRALPPVRYEEYQWQILQALFRLLPLAVSELQHLFLTNNAVDHTEVAMAAAAALGSSDTPGDIALLLDHQIRHILVDEMQDTSHAQYRMLESLTAGWEPGDGRTLFCVGDPMQSIYRFRNAEVGQFLLAQQSGVGSISLQPLVLRQNFRSQASLVDWFNRAFASILAAEDNPETGAIRYSHAVPGLADSNVPAVSVHPVFGDNQNSEDEVGLEVIRQLQQGGEHESIAILVRGRTQLPGLLAALRRAKLEYSAIEIDKLTDLPEVIEPLALTRAAVQPLDRLAWLAILRAPWCGLTWDDLYVLVKGDRDSSVLELLYTEEKLAKLSKAGRDAVEALLPTLQQLVAADGTETLRERVERAWIALGGPAIASSEDAIANVYKFFDVLQAEEQSGTLPDVARLEGTLDEVRVSSGSGARVEVMTMHKAKGLQFDHVVLFGLGRQPGSGNRPVLSWMDTNSGRGFDRRIIAPVGARADEDGDPIHKYISYCERGKQNHELARLLYVACTRARQSLHLIGNVRLDEKQGGCKAPRSDSLLFRLWPMLSDEFTAAAEDALEAGNTDGADWRLPQRRTFTKPWGLPEVRSPFVGEETAESELAGEVEFYWVGTAARIAGTLVHRWLQHIADGRAEANAAANRRELTRRWLSEAGWEADSGNEIVERVQAAVTATLEDKTGQWLLAGEGHSELALTGVVDGVRRSIEIDRVRIDNGEHWLVDYKTSTHEGGNLDGFIAAERTRYQSQLDRYAALYSAWSGQTPRKALYFPLLKRFEEL